MLGLSVVVEGSVFFFFFCRDFNTPLLEQIDLSNNRLKTIPDNLVEHLSSHHFRLLDVSNNELDELPDNVIALFEDRELVIHIFGYSGRDWPRRSHPYAAYNPNWRGEEPFAV
jgi:hypothetical protein